MASDLNLSLRLFYSRMGIILLLFLLPSSLFAQSGDTKLQVEVPDVIVEGEQFNVFFSINDTAKDFQMDAPEGLEVLYGPQQSSSRRTSIVNGKLSRSSYTTYTFVFLADKAGTYTIPAASVKVGSATYRTTPRKVTVVSAGQSGNATLPNNRKSAAAEQAPTPNLSSKDVFVNVSVSKRNVYEQEGVSVIFKIYSAYDFNFDGVKFPEFEGFLVQEVEMPQTLQLQAEEHNGKVYRTVVIRKLVLFPQRSGQLTIPEGKFDLQLQLPVNRQLDSMDSFFDSFFSSYRTVRKSVASNAVTINVKPLPQPAPESFNGAVGQYSLEALKPDDRVRANESYKLSYRLKGDGNIKLVTLPTPKYPEGFDAFDPKESEDIRISESGVRGEKVIDFFSVPRYAGDYVIPGMAFSYFDPKEEQYKEIKLNDVKVHVDPADPNSPTTGTTSYANDKEEVKYLNKDIRYLKDLSKQSVMKLPRTTLFILIYLFLLLALGISYGVIRARNSRKGKKSYISLRAGKMARKWLKLASSKRNSGNSAEYYEALLKGLYNFLSNKFHLPLSVLNKESIAQTLEEHNADPSLIQSTIQTLSDLEFSRYAPSESQIEKDRLFDNVADVINKLDNIKVK